MRFTVVALLIAAFMPATADAQGLRLSAVSTRPEFVSGGDVLVRLDAPAGTQASAVRLTLNGADVSSQLRVDQGGRSLGGVVSGLTVGANQIVATVGNATARLSLVNHPITGAVLSFPQEQPF